MREEIRALKRQRILEEAAKLFAEKGYSATTLDDVAARLKVTKPFIYSQFASKSELLAETFIRIVELCLAAVERALEASATPTDKLQALVREIVLIAAENRIYSAIFLREQKNVDPATLARVKVMEDRWNKGLESLLAEGVEQGEFDVPDVHLASLVIGGQVAWVYSVRESVTDMDPAAVASGIGELVLRMVKRTV